MPDAPLVDRLPPTFADVPYGQDSRRQVMDIWLADSTKPAPAVLILHGGGWIRGDKSGWGTAAIQPLLDQGITVAAANYRFIHEAMEQGIQPPVKACMMDGARALQTLRHHASSWNLDPDRIALMGGSAGACTSLWLALHKDLADPASSDPVARQSSRPSCAVLHNVQTSLDPVQLREWMPNANYAGHAFGFAAEGRPREEEFALLLANRDQVLPWIKTYSPIELATSAAPPIYLNYSNQKDTPIPGQDAQDPTHSAVMGIMLSRRLTELGVQHTLTWPGSEDYQEEAYRAFLIQKLKGQ